MRIEFLCKNYNASEKLKDIITRKVDKLDKFFEDDTKAKIMLKKSKDVETLEITISVSGGIVRAEVAGGNMYENIDLAIPKKFKVKELDFSMPDVEQETKEPMKKVVRSKSYNLIPMTVEDAIEELELVGHDFYVFANKSTGNVNVLYARNDGDYGLIEAIQ